MLTAAAGSAIALIVAAIAYAARRFWRRFKDQLDT